MIKELLMDTLGCAVIVAVIVAGLWVASVSANNEGGYCDYQEMNRGNINNILCYQ